MRRVLLESPFAGDIEAHLAYASLCVRDCLQRGEAPIASHLLYTQPGILDDTKPDERLLGIRAGLAWAEVAEAIVVYTDHGISDGMNFGIGFAKDSGIPVEFRTLPAPK
jgi:hypothetical protein